MRIHCHVSFHKLFRRAKKPASASKVKESGRCAQGDKQARSAIAGRAARVMQRGTRRQEGLQGDDPARQMQEAMQAGGKRPEQDQQGALGRRHSGRPAEDGERAAAGRIRPREGQVPWRMRKGQQERSKVPPVQKPSQAPEETHAIQERPPGEHRVPQNQPQGKRRQQQRQQEDRAPHRVPLHGKESEQQRRQQGRTQR